MLQGPELHYEQWRGIDADDLASAIRQAFDHSIYLARGHNGKRQRARESIEEAWGLTRRELEILTLVAEGHSNAQLARMLWVTEQTVKFHLSNIYRKLNVANRTEASRWAQLHGILPDAPGTHAQQAAVGEAYRTGTENGRVLLGVAEG